MKVEKNQKQNPTNNRPEGKDKPGDGLRRGKFSEKAR